MKIIIVALIACGLILISSCTRNKNTDIVEMKTESKKDDIPFYEIVNDRSSGGALLYDVYIKDADHVIKVNDRLMELNKSKSFITINYFVDRSIARDYFKKQFDDKITASEKNKLFSYYVAMMKKTSGGLHALSKNEGGSWKEIKSY